MITSVECEEKVNAESKSELGNSNSSLRVVDCFTMRDQIMPIKITFWNLIYCYSSFETVWLILLWNELITSVEFYAAYSKKTLHSIELILRDLRFSSNSLITSEGYMMLMTQLTSIYIVAFNL